jgi:hypothetical protein
MNAFLRLNLSLNAQKIPNSQPPNKVLQADVG